MRLDEILQTLDWAGGQEQAVRIVTTAATEVIGIPTSVDRDVEAHEVYVRPLGVEDTEVAISLGAIRRVELL